MPVIHLSLSSFFVAVERRRRPELQRQPVVIGGRPGSQGLVAAASREARRAGVRPGMPLAAAALRCPSATFIDGAIDRYLSAAMDIDAIVRRESSEIEWASIDDIFVGFGIGAGADARPRALVDAAERMRSAVEALGFDAACGIARSKLVASIASRVARPRGVLHILDGYEARFLAPLKIDMLPDSDPRIVRRLRAAGVRRLGQISKLTEQQLTTIAGRPAASLMRLAGGIDRSAIRRTALPAPRICDATLRPPTADSETIRSAIRAEAERVGRQLRSRALFARTLTLRLCFADGHTDSRSAPLPEPSYLDEAIYAAALDLLTQVWVGERLVSAVSVSCAGLLSDAGEARLFPIDAAREPPRRSFQPPK